MSQGPHPAASPLQEGWPNLIPYSQDVMLLLFKIIKAQKKASTSKARPKVLTVALPTLGGLCNS